MAGLKDVVSREYTINLHKRVCYFFNESNNIVEYRYRIDIKHIQRFRPDMVMKRELSFI